MKNHYYVNIIIITIVSSLGLLNASATEIPTDTLEKSAIESGLLDKYRAAIGTEEAIKNISTMHSQWEVDVMGMQGTVEIWLEAPDKQYLKIKLPVMEQVQAMNESITWSMDQNGQISQNARDDLLAAPVAVIPEFQHLFPQSDITHIDAGTKEWEEKNYRILKILKPGDDKPQVMWLNPETFVLENLESQEEGIDVNIKYSKYEMFDQIQIATEFVQQAMIPGIPPTKFKLKSLKTNVTPPNGIFNPPGETQKDYRFDNSAAQFTVPLTTVGEHLFMNVTINGKGPYSFLLDSGAATSLMDISIARELGLDVKDGMKAIGIGGVEDLGAVTVDSFGLGGFGIDNIKMFAADFSSLAEAFGAKLDGIVGYDLFVRTILKLDYLKSELTIIDPEKFEYKGDGDVISGTFSQNLLMIPAVIDGEIEGDIRVDTGAMGEVHLHTPFIEEHGYREKYPDTIKMQAFGAGGAQDITMVRIKSLKIGNQLIEKPIATLMTGEGQGALSVSGSIATVGNGVWSRYTVYFDYQGSRLILEPNGMKQPKNMLNRAGFMARKTDKAIEILMVIPDTPAAEAGLVTGDVILKLNKLDSDDLTDKTINQMLYGPAGTKLRIKYSRDGKTHKTQLTLRDLL